MNDPRTELTDNGERCELPDGTTLELVIDEGYLSVGIRHYCQHGGIIDQAWCGGVDQMYPELVGELLADLGF